MSIDKDDNDLLLEPKKKRKLARPRRFVVIVLNDDFTPMDFVQRMFEKHFHKPQSEAAQLTFEVHRKGRAVAGIFSHEIAETKIITVIMEARKAEHPLMLVMEPLEDNN